MKFTENNLKDFQKEEEAQQLFFTNIKDTLFFQMHRIHITIFRLASKYLLEENCPIRPEQIPVLVTIFRRPHISQQEVADIIQRDKSSVQRTIITLQKKNLIQIDPDAKDKRKNRLVTTENAKEVILQLNKVIENIEKEIAQVFGLNLAKNNIQELKSIADKLEELNKE